MTRRDWLIPFAWALWIGVLATGMLVWSGDGVSSALLGGAALAVAGGSGIRALLRPGPEDRMLAETSPAPILLAVGVTLALNGVAFGLWLLLIGAELAAFGAVLLLREGRLRR